MAWASAVVRHVFTARRTHLFEVPAQAGGDAVFVGDAILTQCEDVVLTDLLRLLPLIQRHPLRLCGRSCAQNRNDKCSRCRQKQSHSRLISFTAPRPVVRQCRARALCSSLHRKPGRRSRFVAAETRGCMAQQFRTSARRDATPLDLESCRLNIRWCFVLSNMGDEMHDMICGDRGGTRTQDLLIKRYFVGCADLGQG